MSDKPLKPRKRKITIPNKGVLETTAQTARAAKADEVQKDREQKKP
jgi:hypothetical protein